MSRLAAIALSLLVASQAFAAIGGRMVCRFTGQTMRGCACPEPESAPRLEAQSCCVILAAPVQPPATTPQSDVRLSLLDFTAAPPALQAPSPTLPRPAPSAGDPLVRWRPLFLQHRALLI
jgi:hypothetical protein